MQTCTRRLHHSPLAILQPNLGISGRSYASKQFPLSTQQDPAGALKQLRKLQCSAMTEANDGGESDVLFG